METPHDATEMTLADVENILNGYDWQPKNAAKIVRRLWHRFACRDGRCTRYASHQDCPALHSLERPVPGATILEHCQTIVGGHMPSVYRRPAALIVQALLEEDERLAA